MLDERLVILTVLTQSPTKRTDLYPNPFFKQLNIQQIVEPKKN